MRARETTVTVLRINSKPVAPAIGSQLGLESRAVAVHAVRLRSAGGIPLMLTDAWVPERVGRHVTAQALQTRALFEILMDEGIKFGRVVQEVNIGTALLRMVRILYDRRRLPLQHITIHVTSERSRILMDPSAGVVNTVGAGQIVHERLDLACELDHTT